MATSPHQVPIFEGTKTSSSPVFFEVHPYVALEHFQRTCTQSERVQYEAVPLEKRTAWLSGRYVVKNAIRKMYEAHNMHISILDIEIHNTDAGVPYAVSLPSGNRLPVHLSISHAHGYACGAVIPSESVNGLGIDIEQMRTFATETLDAFLTSEEKEFLATYADAMQMYYATLLWSIKEAYLKACGVGLRVHPRSITCEFGLSSDTVTLKHDGVPVELQSVYWTTIDDLYILVIITL